MTTVSEEASAARQDDDPRAETVRRFFAALQSGDHDTMLEVLAPDAVTRWPQSGERATGAMACVRIYENYPGGPPAYRVSRISGAGEMRVAELIADYGEERWFTVSIVEFDGERIVRMTDYFGQAFPAPEWRREMVELE
jgi:limonene-1,2-epoxide hydrolase